MSLVCTARLWSYAGAHHVSVVATFFVAVVATAAAGAVVANAPVAAASAAAAIVVARVVVVTIAAVAASAGVAVYAVSALAVVLGAGNSALVFKRACDRFLGTHHGFINRKKNNERRPTHRKKQKVPVADLVVPSQRRRN